MTRRMRSKGRPAARALALAALVLTAAWNAPLAGQTATQGTLPLAAGLPEGQVEAVPLTAGRSTVLATPFDITRIAVTNPAVADAVVVQPREILIDGKGAGTVSLIVWGAGGQRRHYDLVVDPGVLPIQQQLQQLFPGEDIRVSLNDEAIILSGKVSSNNIKLRAAEIAGGTQAKNNVINLLQLPTSENSQQVMLQVRFAEVNRRALTELGLNLFAIRDDFLARTTTQQFGAPDIDTSGEGGTARLNFSDLLNIFFFQREEGIGAVLKALEGTGYFQSLAEPNLIAYNGQEASFLAGGEFPVPIVQGLAGAVTIQYKEFGVRLTFKPTIAGDVIRLHVRPEVSALDFNNGVTLEGFRIPALTTRRAETDVELRDGQSFAIAGLLNNIAQNDGTAIPILSKIPIIGYLFRSKAERKEQTELLVLITPRLVRPLDPDEVPTLPTRPGSFLPSSAPTDLAKPKASGLTDAPPPTVPKPGDPGNKPPALK